MAMGATALDVLVMTKRSSQLASMAAASMGMSRLPQLPELCCGFTQLSPFFLITKSHCNIFIHITMGLLTLGQEWQFLRASLIRLQSRQGKRPAGRTAAGSGQRCWPSTASGTWVTVTSGPSPILLAQAHRNVVLFVCKQQVYTSNTQTKLNTCKLSRKIINYEWK